MRDRLVELIKEAKAIEESGIDCKVSDEYIAEHLLSEGVIVPPYKPMPLIDEGDRVLCPICETDLMGCYDACDDTPTVVTCYKCGAWLDNTKAVTREEAEAAIAERSENAKAKHN